MIYYIHNDEFITTDTELTENIGELKLSDYQSGKYILLNETLIQYMNEHPKASPLEVFLLQDFEKMSSTQSKMCLWYYDNAEKVIINGKRYDIFDWMTLLLEARVYLELGRENMTFSLWGDKYLGTTLEIYLFLLQFGGYCCDLERIREVHYNYIELHPNNEDYDYTIGVPLVISVNFEKL